MHREALAKGLIELADAVEGGRPARVIAGLLADNEIACHGAIAEQTGAAQELLRHFIHALETWQRVWPQMGSREEFRMAVVREARQWSARLRAK